MGDERENCEGEEKMRATERKVRVWYVYVLKKKEKGNPYILLSVFVICNNIIDGSLVKSHVQSSLLAETIRH